MQKRPYRLPVVYESSTLDSSARLGPSLGRVRTSPTLSRISTNTSSRGTLRRSSGTSTPKPGELRRRVTLADRVADLDNGALDKGPWNKNSAFYVPKKSWKEIGADCQAFEEEQRRRKEAKRLARQFDGSRSRSSSITPSSTRINSFRSIGSTTPFYSGPSSRVNSLKHSETESTVSSVPSSVSGNSGDSAGSSRRATRLREVETVGKDDRINQGHEAQQEQQPREPDAGADRKQDFASYGGQGQRGFFGRYKDKNPRYVFVDFSSFC